MNKENYRGTGLTKQECQDKVDKVIAEFKSKYPNKSVPVVLENWVENIADDKDVEMALKRMKANYECKTPLECFGGCHKRGCPKKK